MNYESPPREKMNTYQRIATFVLRLGGFAMIAIAVSGLTYFAILLAYGRADTIARDRVWGSIIWFVVGSILLASARPLGRFFGRGLD